LEKYFYEKGNACSYLNKRLVLAMKPIKYNALGLSESHEVSLGGEITCTTTK